MSKKWFIAIAVLLYVLFTIVFNFFPRSTFSELEKRDLSRFPAFTADSLASGKFTSALSSWYSDTEPFRDFFMACNTWLKDVQGISLGENNVRLVLPAEGDEMPMDVPSDIAVAGSLDVDDEEEGIVADLDSLAGKVKIANSGILLVGTGGNVRAVMCFRASIGATDSYARTINKYREAFPDNVRIYCMPIPTSSEYYCPPGAENRNSSQIAHLHRIFSVLAPGVDSVNVQPVLARHTGEPIYLRTDHHWSPLGAYYAAREFASVAGVPFRGLDAYEERVVHNVVGSMYGYTRDRGLKNAPEDFVYYVPKEVEYSCTYTTFITDENFNVTSVWAPTPGEYFVKKKDGASDAYSTFMGSDARMAVVKTSTHNGRKLVILKDSYGNAVPSNLFYSFEEVHVVDFRYCNKNLVKYVQDNGITDILFVNNTFNTVTPFVTQCYRRLLTQKDGELHKAEPKESPEDSVSSEVSPEGETPAQTEPAAPEPVEASAPARQAAVQAETPAPADAEPSAQIEQTENQ